jgi:membrane protease YdiL (CAAX protease family)
MTHRWILSVAAFPGARVLAQHALVFALAVLFPVWDHYAIPRLKASTDPMKRIRFYRKIMAAEWVCTLVAWFTVGLGALYTMAVIPGDITWLAEGTAGRSFMAGLASAVALVLVLPAILAIWSEKVRTKAAKAAQSLSYLLPSTKEERLLWWPLCITAGVCEEFLYRGFLLHYFHTTPFRLSLTWAMVVAAVIFGLGHLYQGWKGALSTAVLGFALGAVFVVTGSLLIPIVAHALLDLRVLLLLPGVEAETAAA